MKLIARILDDASYWASGSVCLEHPVSVPIRGDGKGSYLMHLRTLALGIHVTEGDFSPVGQDF